MAVQVLSPLDWITVDWIKNHFISGQEPFSDPLMKYPPKPKPYSNNHNHELNPNPKQTICAQPDRQKQWKPSRPNNTSPLKATSTLQKHTVVNDQLSSQAKLLNRPVIPHQLSPPPKRNHPIPQKVQELSYSSPNPNQGIRAQPDSQKQQKPSRSNNPNSLQARSVVQKLAVPNNKLSGQVNILKRGGEQTGPAAPHEPSPPPKRNCSSPQKVQEFELRFYAGTCTSCASPSPSLLPLPSFLANKRVVSNN